MISPATGVERLSQILGLNISDPRTIGVIPKACVFSSRPRDLAWSALNSMQVRARSLPRLECAEFQDDLVMVRAESSKLLP